MNSKFNLLFLLAVCCVAITIALPQRRGHNGMVRCPLDQEFTTCGSACPERCEGGPRFCTLQCIVGCQCRRGTVLNSAGRCVKPSEC